MSDSDTLFDFPCQFPIKAMGKARPDLDVIVLECILPHVESIREGAVKIRESKGGKYFSVTVTIEATSRQQLDAIYQSLTDCPEIVMVL
jgi:putative lipoic acid-binding regulatory protein